MFCVNEKLIFDNKLILTQRILNERDATAERSYFERN